MRERRVVSNLLKEISLTNNISYRWVLSFSVLSWATDRLQASNMSGPNGGDKISRNILCLDWTDIQFTAVYFDFDWLFPSILICLPFMLESFGGNYFRWLDMSWSEFWLTVDSWYSFRAFLLWAGPGNCCTRLYCAPTMVISNDE